jgi:LysM repeat protein
MKILKISGIVAAIHVALFLLVFAIPGCHSTGNPAPATVAIADNPAPGAGNAAPIPAIAPALQPPSAPGFDPDAPAAPRSYPTRPGTAAAIALAPPPPPAPAPLTPASVGTRHTVANGESLWSIAQKYKVTPAALAKVNNISTSAVLHPGQKLLVPDGGRTPVAAPMMPEPAVKAGAAPALPEMAGGATHVVKSGETLGAIARSYGVKVGDLEVANHITDPAKIRVGQTLKIPPSAKSTPKPAGVATPAVEPAIGPAPAPPAAPVDLGFKGLSDSAAPAPAPAIKLAPAPPPPASPPAADAPVIKVDDSGAPRIP